MLNLSMIQGATGGPWNLSIYESDGVTPQPLSGTTIIFNAAYAAANFKLTKTSPSSGITIVNSAGGLNCALLQIEPGDTTSLSLGLEAVAVMDCELKLQNGSEVYPLNTGTLSVTGNVGTP